MWCPASTAFSVGSAPAAAAAATAVVEVPDEWGPPEPLTPAPPPPHLPPPSPPPCQLTGQAVPLYIKSASAPSDAGVDWPACMDSEWQPELRFKDLKAGASPANQAIAPLCPRWRFTPSLPADAWGIVFSFLPMSVLLPSETFFHWSRARAAVLHCGLPSFPPSPTHSLHLVCKFFQQRVLLQLLHCFTGRPTPAGTLQPHLQALLHQMTVIPQFQSLHQQLITAGYVVFRTLAFLAPSGDDSLAEPYSRNTIVFKIALGRLNTMHSFRIRDIASVLPSHLHGNVVAQKLMLKAIMASQNGDLAHCMQTTCLGDGKCSMESGLQCPKKWEDLDFMVRTEKEQVDDAFKVAVIEVLFHARYSSIRLDDSLGPSVLQLLGQRLLMHGQSDQKSLRPLLLTFVRPSTTAHSFLIEVLAQLIQSRRYTYLMIHSTTTSLQPILDVLGEEREDPCWGTYRLNQMQFHHQGDARMPLEDATPIVHIDVLNLNLKFVPKGLKRSEVKERRGRAKPRVPLALAP